MTYEKGAFRWPFLKHTHSHTRKNSCEKFAWIFLFCYQSTAIAHSACAGDMLSYKQFSGFLNGQQNCFSVVSPVVWRAERQRSIRTRKYRSIYLHAIANNNQKATLM